MSLVKLMASPISHQNQSIELKNDNREAEMDYYGQIKMDCISASLMTLSSRHQCWKQYWRCHSAPYEHYMPNRLRWRVIRAISSHNKNIGSCSLVFSNKHSRGGWWERNNVNRGFRLSLESDASFIFAPSYMAPSPSYSINKFHAVISRHALYAHSAAFTHFIGRFIDKKLNGKYHISILSDQWKHCAYLKSRLFIW